ncbi:MAG: hypothetical protein LBQ68_08430, partial [Clostridiales bacterium]|nr:hypothetical protein [Clostridiales bacterium]
DNRSFSYFNTPRGHWAHEGGVYSIQIAASSRDIKLEQPISVKGDGFESAYAALREKVPAYYKLSTDPKWDTKQFEAVYNKPLPIQTPVGKPFTDNNTLDDIKNTFIGKQLNKAIKRNISKTIGAGDEGDMSRMIAAMLMDMPLRSLSTMSNGALSRNRLNGLLAMINGNFLKGLRLLAKN